MYVVQKVPTPAVDADWSFVVPGQSLYHLIAVRAVALIPSGNTGFANLSLSDGLHAFSLPACTINTANTTPIVMTWCHQPQTSATNLNRNDPQTLGLGDVLLPAGYRIEGHFTNLSGRPFQWSQITVWADDLNTTPIETLIGAPATSSINTPLPPLGPQGPPTNV